jgi:uroporphyrinogen III methyltransferase/synthase
MTIKPLGGKRILITRPAVGAQSFAQKLCDLGAEPLLLPTIALAPPEDWSPVDRALGRLDRYDWVIFTSANGVRFALARLRALGLGVELLRRVKIAAIGPATAQALQGQGLSVDFMPTRYVAEAISDGLGDVCSQRILLLRADIARRELRELLQAKGADVEEIAVYRTQPAALQPEQVQQLFQQGIDIVTFTSASTVQALMRLLGKRCDLLDGVTIACIGPITAHAAEEAGLQVHIVAREHTIDGLISAILQEVSDHARSAPSVNP